MIKHDILYKAELPFFREGLARLYNVYESRSGSAYVGPDAAVRQAKVLVTTGSLGASRAEIDALPGLGLICCLGVGYENVDISAARERNILTTYGGDANAAAVADHAMMLLLATMRDIVTIDQNTRRGIWRDHIAPRPTPTGKRIGLLGLGGIGERIARRAEAFDMTVSYCTRTARPDIAWRHVASVVELAANVDCLVVAIPGGAETRHIVSTAVLQALGPDGFLVNIARGSVVDTAALVAALRDGTIRGAGLDVYEDEPGVPDALKALPNVVLTPHIAALSPEVQTLTLNLACDNIERFLNGLPVLTPIPRTAALAGA